MYKFGKILADRELEEGLETVRKWVIRLDRSLGFPCGLVTALNPVLGYEKSAAIAKEALVTNLWL
jgi:fumarate hydratase class II